jgi:tetratricopeptide (TPR) repeat protein
MVARFDDARAHIGHARAIFEELGLLLAVNDASALALAEVELLAGRVELAAQKLREACDTCIRLNESSLLASRAAQLADALYSLTEYDAAERWTQVSRESTDREDLHAQASWRCIASRLAARRGDIEVALRLIDEANEILAQGDGLNQQAKLQLDLAEVLRLAGREEESLDGVQRAVHLYERKGNTAAAEQARSLLTASAAV